MTCVTTRSYDHSMHYTVRTMRVTTCANSAKRINAQEPDEIILLNVQYKKSLEVSSKDTVNCNIPGRTAPTFAHCSALTSTTYDGDRSCFASTLCPACR